MITLYYIKVVSELPKIACSEALLSTVPMLLLRLAIGYRRYPEVFAQLAFYISNKFVKVSNFTTDCFTYVYGHLQQKYFLTKEIAVLNFVM